MARPTIRTTIRLPIIDSALSALMNLEQRYRRNDAINRAIIAYDYIDSHLADGKQIAVYDPESETFTFVRMESKADRPHHLRLVEGDKSDDHRG